MENIKVGDKVTINASRSIPVSITGIILAIDYGDPLHAPETMVFVETNNAKLWIYAWRLSF